MPKERAQPFSGVHRFVPVPSGTSSSPHVSRASQLGLGLGGKGALGLGKGKSVKRHKKIPRDTIYGITKGDIRRLARRGGVKRISADVYEEIRISFKARLELILRRAVAVAEHTGRKTIVVRDVIYALNGLGKPIYGFDPAFA